MQMLFSHFMCICISTFFILTLFYNINQKSPKYLQMKKISSLKKFAPRGIMLFILLLFSQVSTYSQTIIYKKDGLQIQVSQLDTLSRTFSYRLYSQNDSTRHYISKRAIDSIRFDNGTRIFNNPPIMFPDNKEKEERIKRNFIGFDIWPFFQGRVNAFYEILYWSDKLGFKNSFTYEKYTNYDNQDFADFSVTSGMNYYFLQSEYFRFGSGIAIEIGKKDEYDYDSYFAYENYYNYSEDYKYTNPPIIREPYRFFYFNVSFSYIFKRTLYSTLEVSLPIVMKRAINDPTYVKTEIAINF